MANNNTTERSKALEAYRKLNLINVAADALAEVCVAFECTPETALPMIIALTEKTLSNKEYSLPNAKL